MTALFEFSDRDRFLLGLAIVLGLLWALLVAIRTLTPLARWTYRWCLRALREEPSNVVNLADRRRQLDAAAGRRAS